MRKGTIAILFILSVIMALVGAGLIVAGVVGSTFTPSSNGYPTTGHFGNLPLFITGIILASLAGIPYLIAWIGALINLARLQQWVWFVLLFIFHGLALLIYLVAGPTRPAGMPPYPQYQQYPQNPQYPQYPPQYPQSMSRDDLPPQPPPDYRRS